MIDDRTRTGPGPLVPGGQLHHRHHLLAPSFTGPTGHYDIGHGRMSGNGPLHFLDEDLLTPGVHGDRVAAQELNLPVVQVPSPVAWNRVPHAIDHRERTSRLLGIAEVAQGDAAGLRQPAVALVPRVQEGRHRLVDDHGAGSGQEGSGRAVASGDHVHLGARFRRAGGVGDDQVGQPGQRQLAHGRGQRSAAVAHGEEGGQVVTLLVQLHDQGAQDSVAHDGHGVGSLALDGPPHIVGVNPARVVGEDDRRPLGHEHEGGPLCRTVHEGRQEEEAERHALGQALGDALIAGDDLPGPHLPTTHGRHEDVVLAPQHTLGHAGGAARVEDVQVVGGGVDRCPLR